MKGLDVVYALRDLERSDDTSFRGAGVPAGEIGRRLRRKDGRAVTAKLQRLQDAGLVERWPQQTWPNWRSTKRGREVEALCSAADAARGGSFRPRHEVVTDLTERLALAL